MRLLTALLPMLGSLLISGATYAASEPQCLNGLMPTLVAGGFSGSVDCQRDKLSVNHVGQMLEFGRTFEVYSYRYRLRPACTDCVIHGGRRIIFLERGRYVGQYRSDFVRVTIRNGHLELVQTHSPHEATIVAFTADGPPKKLWVDGEVVGFSR